MKHVEWLAGAAAVLLTGCTMLHHAVPISQPREPGGIAPRSFGHSTSSALTPDYLVRPDTGERRILGQLLRELQLVRHLIDDAHARRDGHGRVRIDYARLSAEYDQIIVGLRRTLAAAETTPREPADITGDYQLYE